MVIQSVLSSAHYMRCLSSIFCIFAISLTVIGMQLFCNILMNIMKTFCNITFFAISQELSWNIFATWNQSMIDVYLHVFSRYYDHICSENMSQIEKYDFYLPPLVLSAIFKANVIVFVLLVLSSYRHCQVHIATIKTLNRRGRPNASLRVIFSSTSGQLCRTIYVP